MDRIIKLITRNTGKITLNEDKNMTLQQLLNVMGSHQKKSVKLKFIDKNRNVICTAVASSSFIVQLYDREIENLRASNRDEFVILLKGEI